jgi:hypothetical protein
MRSQSRAVDALLLTVIVLLTLSTAYIHYYVGGTMLMLNALGYVTLTVAVIGSALFARRFLPLVLIALALYAAVTIVGWLIMGPYFSTAYLAKAIEVVLIITIAITLRRMRDETRAALMWLRQLPSSVTARGGK